MPNLLITPRTAFYSDQAFEEQCDAAVAMVAAFLQTEAKADAPEPVGAGAEAAEVAAAATEEATEVA